MDNKSVEMTIKEHEKAMGKAIAIAFIGSVIGMSVLISLVYVISFWL
mgnify:FL=1